MVVGNPSIEIISHWKCGRPQRCAFVTLLCICGNFLLNVTSKCCKHHHWNFHLLLEEYFTATSCQNQPWKQENLLAPPCYCFCRRLALKPASGAGCVYMQAGSPESSRCCSCTTVAFAFTAASCAGPPLPPRVALKWESRPIPSCTPLHRWACFTYTEITWRKKLKQTTKQHHFS